MFSISVLLQVAGYAEWFNLSSLPANGLMCRERRCLGWIKPCECGMVVGARLEQDILGTTFFVNLVITKNVGLYQF